MSTQADHDELNKLMGFTPLHKGDLGAVSVEEKQALWPNEEEAKRQEVVNQNGNTGEHYKYCSDGDT